MDADGAKSLGICAAAARPEVDAGRGRRETFVDGRLLEYLDSPALAWTAGPLTLTFLWLGPDC